MTQQVLGGAGIGYHLESTFALAYNRGGAVTKGQVRMLDMEVSEATVGTYDTTGASVWNNMVPVTTAGLDYAYFAVATEDIADDALGKWQFKGLVEECEVTDASTTIGDRLQAVNADTHLTNTLTAGAKIIGIAMEVWTASPAANGRVAFDGINGFGVT